MTAASNGAGAAAGRSDARGAFLQQAGLADARIEPIPGDASFRRYFRVRERGGSTAMLMDAPPPEEDVRPYAAIARYLLGQGFAAPAILAADEARGFLLIEDFGDCRMREYVDAAPGEEARIYAHAIDTLVALHATPPAALPPYDMAEYLREVGLFTGWYCPAQGIEADEAAWEDAWRTALAPVIEAQRPGVTVLRDYHAENVMLLADGRQGLLDFQDARVGHPAYDLVSLLQDARRDVPPALESEMIDRYRRATDAGADFDAHYAVLGAQRNAKIVGIFVRLWRRDGKPRYLPLIERVWRQLERDLAHPALAPVARWFDTTIPDALRTGGPVPGGRFEA